MFSSARRRCEGRSARVRRAGRSKLIGLGVAVIAVTSMAAVAVAATTTVGTGNATVSGKSKTVVVNSSGVTLYILSGETVRNLKCVASACFKAWPPYKVSANARLTKAKGVPGTLSKLRRIKGKFYQVMLNGHPLYTFAGDMGRKGSAKGQGIKAFGGSWLVIPAI